jgi:predicted enzyme related to lactoylglutathione lyase
MLLCGLAAGTLSVLAHGLVLWAQTRGSLAPIPPLREPIGQTRITAAVPVVADIVRAAQARRPGKRRRRPGPPRLRYDPAMHRSRLCHFVIDVPDLDQGVSFWSAALNATGEPLPEQVRHIARRLRLPDSEIRILVQKTSDEKASKERMHLDLEADDIEAEVSRLEALGATRWDHQAEHGFEFWVLRDPWGNEFCVLPPFYPELLARQEPWNHGPATG